MNKRALVFGVLAALAGCGDDATPGITSGQRIKVQYFEFDDGTRQATAPLYDSARGEGCYPSMWSDGILRCTPSSQSSGVPNSRYLDETCRDDHRGFELYEGAPYYVGETAVDGRQERLVRLDPVYVSAYWYRDELGCHGPSETGLTVGIAGAEVPRTELAVLEERWPTAGDGRLATSALVTDDGLDLPNRLRDTELDFDCWMPTIADGRRVCLPFGAASVTYRDAACVEPVAHVPATVEVPRFVAESRGCEARLFEVGGERKSGGGFQRDFLGACVAAEIPADGRWFALTAREPAVLERVAGEPSGDRLSPFELHHGSLRHPDGALLDREDGLECYPGQDAEGTYRCLPGRVAPIFELFTDDTCTTPRLLAISMPPFDGCPAAGPRFGAPWIDVISGSYRRITTRFSAPVWHRDGTGPCVAGFASWLPRTSELYDLGEAVPVTHFVGGSLVPDRD